jgi:hypothetical protein
LEEGIVGLQIMGFDDHCVSCSVSSNNRLRWLTQTTRETCLVDARAYVGCTESACNKGTSHSFNHVVSAVAVYETGKFTDLVIELDASSSDFLQIGATLGRKIRDGIATSRALCTGTSSEKFLPVYRVLDFSATVPTAYVPCDFAPIGNNPHGLLISTDQNVPAY